MRFSATPNVPFYYCCFSNNGYNLKKKKWNEWPPNCCFTKIKSFFFSGITISVQYKRLTFKLTKRKKFFFWKIKVILRLATYRKINYMHLLTIGLCDCHLCHLWLVKAGRNKLSSILRRPRPNNNCYCKQENTRWCRPNQHKPFCMHAYTHICKSSASLGHVWNLKEEKQMLSTILLLQKHAIS